MTEPMLAVAGVNKRFGAITVAEDVSFAVTANSIHALIGPNGAGKTSVLNILSGLLRPDSGRIALCGDTIDRLPAHERARRGLGRGFQAPAIFDEFTVLENVAIALQARNGSSWRFVRSSRAEAGLNDAARSVLQTVELEARAGEPAGRLSHGERRMLELAVARAIVPHVLLLDEPLAGAGAAEAAGLLALLDGLRATCAVVLVEHDMDAVFSLADTITVLDQGRVIASGEPHAIRADPAVRTAYLGDAF